MRPAGRPIPHERQAETITVLHLADLQFGARHRPTEGLTDVDQSHDRLAARLLDDLTHLREKYGLIPDLVMVAGDLAEQAKPAEYELVYEFLNDLVSGLSLPKERIVIVPGNHDVNRKKCQAYVLSCEADDEEPIPPYWPKWEMFAAMYSRFTGQAFPKDQPWTYHEIPDLKVAIAGLNTTMADSHRDEDHYGWVGEVQLRDLASKLEGARRSGWLRLGVMHHNPIRGNESDGAHLRDADRFEEILASRLHVVFHGHTHHARIQRLGPSALPVLCTGSAGVIAKERPPGVPNQYHIVRITRDGLRISARRYDLKRRKWIGDTSISNDGDDWHRKVPTTFADVDAALPPPIGQDINDSHGDFPSERAAFPRTRRGDSTREDDFHREDLLGRVAEVCRLRLPSATVTEVTVQQPDPDRPDPDATASPRLSHYLRVAVPHGESSDRPVGVDQYPIGICDHAPTRHDIASFVSDVVALFRSGGSPVSATLVCDRSPIADNPKSADELRDWARGRGVRLLSFAEYQLGDDLVPFARRQADTLRADRIYPSGLYVEQRYTELDYTGRPWDDDPPRLGMLDRLRGWLRDPAGHLIVVLAPFGHGKTFLLRELARRMHTEADPVIPVLVNLRELEKAHEVDQLVASQLIQGGERRVNLALFHYLLREGRIALLFDGFDELVLRVTYDKATDHLDRIIKAAQGRAKVILTSRDHYFLNDSDVARALAATVEKVYMRRLRTVPGRRITKLANFNNDQIKEETSSG